MHEQIKAKLEKMSREDLLKVIEGLCEIPDVQKKVKLIISPTKSDVDRAARKFYTQCEIYRCNSCNTRDYDRALEAMDPLFAAYKFANPQISAYIIWSMYRAVWENDMQETEHFDMVMDLLSDLETIINNYADLFSTSELEMYKSIIED